MCILILKWSIFFSQIKPKIFLQKIDLPPILIIYNTIFNSQQINLNEKETM